MGLWRDVWELIDGPRSARLRGKRSGRAVWSWRVAGAVMLVLFMSGFLDLRADPSPRAVLVTAELSFEVVSQLDDAVGACRADRGFEGLSCAVEVWKSCHLAKQALEESGENLADGKRNAAGFLCDAAVVADAGELASVLAFRYGEEYYRQNLFYIPKFSGNPFNMFHDLVDLEFRILDASSAGYPKDAEKADSYNVGVRLGGSSRNYPKYRAISAETVDKLRLLEDAIRDFFRPYRTLKRFTRATESLGSVPEVGANPWLVPDAEFLKADPGAERLCRQARQAARENHLRWQQDIDSCLSEAASCQNRHSANRAPCSPEAGAAEFERMWQELPAVCAAADDITEEYSSDACRSAALAVCDYRHISPNDHWLGQLISMRDFACATAGDTPELRATLNQHKPTQ